MCSCSRYELQASSSTITCYDHACQQCHEQHNGVAAPHIKGWFLHAGQTALVFGREESGLTEAELRLCAQSCAIPTGRIQPSMNLSHAVAVVLSCLFSKRLQLLGLADLGIELTGGFRGRVGTYRGTCTG